MDPPRRAWPITLNGFWCNLLNPKVILFFMTFLPQFVSAADPHVAGKLIFLGFWAILAGMPVNMMVVLVAEKLSGMAAEQQAGASRHRLFLCRDLLALRLEDLHDAGAVVRSSFSTVCVLRQAPGFQ